MLFKLTQNRIFLKHLVFINFKEYNQTLNDLNYQILFMQFNFIQKFTNNERIRIKNNESNLLTPNINCIAQNIDRFLSHMYVLVAHQCKYPAA